MYSNLKSIQILISLLHQYGIKDVVLSPGGSDIPIIHSIETDRAFTCHSVVDERSAVYFAMGLAQEKSNPVACVCTSGTAVCNYLPGITEAHYQNVPVLAITADKNPYFLEQLETQKINQENIFNGVVKKAVNLPLVNNDEDEWLCNRLINEALLELNHHGTGPVHINIPIVGDISLYNCESLPKVRKINRTYQFSEENIWKKYAEALSASERIMVVVGQNVKFDDEFCNTLNKFFAKFNCMYAVEHLSNLDCDGTINTYILTEMLGVSEMKGFEPDIVISIGNNLAAYKLKPFLREHYRRINNWLVSENDVVRDAYKCLTEIFECEPKTFFDKMVKYVPSNTQNDEKFYQMWKEKVDKISLPEFEFSNFYVGEELARIIPENSLLHCAILNSTRMMQFFDLKKNVRMYSNVGALGIDGCFSSFVGQAVATDKLAFLLIGDLSFFYDMNAASLRSIGNNVRVILINNGGGSEFHFFMGRDRISTIDDFICAQHANTAEGWIRSLGYKYYSASNENMLKSALNEFNKPSKKPMFLEVFTNMEDDAKKTNKFYNENSIALSGQSNLESYAKAVTKKVLSDKQIKNAKRLINTFKKK